MKIFFKTLLILFLSVFSLALYANAMTFGVTIAPTMAYTHDTAAPTKANYEKLAQNLSKQLKTPVKLEVFSNPMDLIQAVDAGKVDFAYACVMPFAKAMVTKQNIVPLMTVLNWNKDKSKKIAVNDGYLVTLASNKDINTVKDLKNAKLGFAKYSASGYYLPAQELQKDRLAYSFHFYNSQYAAIEALKAGKVAVIALWDPMFNVAKEKVDIKTIATINNVPNGVIVASNKVSAADQAKIKQAFMALPESAFQNLRFVGVQPFNPALYQNTFKAVQTVAGPSA